MLTEKEEQRVDYYIHISSTNEAETHYDQTNAAFRWLGYKIKQLNMELQEANELNAKLSKRHE